MPNNIEINPNQIGVDAGLRLRVSQLTTLGDYKNLNYEHTLLFENAGTGTGSWATNKYSMSVGANEWLIKNTLFHHQYFSGKSQMIECTLDGFDPESGVTKRVGYFSSNTVSPYASTYDGFWIESDGSTIRLIVSRAGTQTLNVPLEDWSGYNELGEYQSESRWANFTVVMFDFLWLGGAQLRLWVKTNHGFILAHSFQYSGSSEDVFILSPNHPIRYEIRSSGGTGSMRHICAQASTEGSIEESGLTTYFDTGSTLISLATPGTSYPLLGMQLNSSYHDIVALLDAVSLFLGTANDTAKWTIQINPTLSAPLTYGAVTGFGIQTAVGNGTITVSTPGTVIAGGGVSTASSSGGTAESRSLDRSILTHLMTKLDGTSVPLVLCMTPIAAGLSVYAGLGVRQY